MSVPLRFAAAAWAVAWVVGGVVLGGVVLVVMNADGSAFTIGQLAVYELVIWMTFAVALYLVSARVGTGDLVADYRVAIRPVDLIGIPAGIVVQLVAVPALYWPLQQIWSGTFSDDRLEERAVDLADRATAEGKQVLLVAVVVIGAPLFEELVYRGLLQRSLMGAIGTGRGLVVAAAWFGLIHLEPVELPGLFLAGLLFGAALALTDRLGPAFLAHAAFNATGLVMAFRAR